MEPAMPDPPRSVALPGGRVGEKPDPDLPDPKRMDRLRAKAGLLMVRLSREDMAMSQREKAARAIVGTPGGAAEARWASAEEEVTEDAGVFVRRVSATMLDAAESGGMLTWRQAEAWRELSRLYRKGGGQVPGVRGNGGSDVDSDARADARRQHRDLHAVLPAAMHGPAQAIVQGEWPVTCKVSAVQDWGDAMADRLRLAP